MPQFKDNPSDFNTQLTSVSITKKQHGTVLSKGQKTFNLLVKKIGQRRARLAAWDTVTPLFQKQYHDELLPLLEAGLDLQVEMVHRLDRVCDQKGLTKPERRKISSFITDVAGELIAQRDDTELKDIYNKHSASDYDSEEAAELEGLKSMLKSVLNIDLGDDVDMCSPEDIMRAAQAQMAARQEQQAATHQAIEERQVQRKKSAKQIAAQAREEAEKAQLSQSIREVYRKLASALHPDREPDPQERVRKTALMQRANQAYDRNDILQLLELQLELEHIDQSTINTISEDRLKHYTKILKEQIGELDQEILYVESSFKYRYEIAPFIEIHPDTILGNIADDIAGLQEELREFESDLRAFEDVAQVKDWLKTMKRQQAMPRFEEMLF